MGSDVDDNVDTSSVSRDIKSAVIQYWENTDPKRERSKFCVRLI